MQIIQMDSPKGPNVTIGHPSPLLTSLGTGYCRYSFFMGKLYINTKLII